MANFKLVLRTYQATPLAASNFLNKMGFSWSSQENLWRKSERTVAHVDISDPTKVKINIGYLESDQCSEPAQSEHYP